MTAFTPKTYQRDVLDSVSAYFEACHAYPSPAAAFTDVVWQRFNASVAYQHLDGMADAPYFCLRVPTGGGKTWLAAKSVALINTRLLRVNHSVILWLVPSTAIREQTLRALRDRQHPYHAALREAGPVSVLDLDEAKSVTPATLATSTTIIVCTRQAFQVEDVDKRKVYDASGALMAHFEHLPAEQRTRLHADEHGVVPQSLTNVLRLHRPFVIVDEAHNSRTELAFDTLARFAPSGIMELTATPDTDKTPSNVLHSVSAAELKAEEMIKLPIVLECEPDWQRCLHYAIDQRDQLGAIAQQAERAGADYLRPIVLIQADRRRQGVDTLDVDAVRSELINNQHIPAEQIAVATGDVRDLEKIDADYARGINDPHCPVQYVITQQALAEGWDCPFAYILVSMADIRSAKAVEQLLGRILRQPGATHRPQDALNQSYAYVVSRDFRDTAASLRDKLVAGAGFERRDVGQFVTARTPANRVFDFDNQPTPATMRPIHVELAAKPAWTKIPKPTRDKIEWSAPTSTRSGGLTIRVPLTDDDTTGIQGAMDDDASRQAIATASQASRDAVAFFQTPAERGLLLDVPQLALRQQGELFVFDDPDMLEYPCALSTYDATPTASQLQQLDANRVAEGGTIDVDDESGRVKTTFIHDLQRDLGLTYRPQHWDDIRLATWLAANLPDRAITHADKRAFVAHWLTELLRRSDFDLARANRQKFMIRTLLEKRIRELRDEAATIAFQDTLFGEHASARVGVSAADAYRFHPQGYAPSKDYDGHYGPFDFRHHYYGRVGDFDSEEEFRCACWLDDQAEHGHIRFWVRNLVRKSASSFFLQKATGRFYPDFICELVDGSILVVEYKGADRWQGAEDDRLIGSLWAGLSDGHCRFVMTKNKDWSPITAEINDALKADSGGG